MAHTFKTEHVHNHVIVQVSAVLIKVTKPETIEI